jgi:hypothetical protein
MTNWTCSCFPADSVPRRCPLALQLLPIGRADRLLRHHLLPGAGQEQFPVAYLRALRDNHVLHDLCLRVMVVPPGLLQPAALGKPGRPRTKEQGVVRQQIAISFNSRGFRDSLKASLPVFREMCLMVFLGLRK